MTHALPSYSEVVTVRDEILGDEGLVDQVDLAHLIAPEAAKKKRQKLGERVPVAQAVRDPAAFFRMTFPTEDVRQTLFALQARAKDPNRVAGTIVLNGRYGLGKSHVLLAAHHALSQPEEARAWAASWELDDLELPAGARVATRSFIHRTTEHLWSVLFEAMGCPERSSEVRTYPDAEMIASVLDDRPTFLVLDELERWFAALPDKTTRARNLAFLQALTEVADRDRRLTLLTSVLGIDLEPAETLRRTRPLELTFRSELDRQRVLLFRLFSNHGAHDRAKVEAVADAYVDEWRKAGITGLDEVRARLLDTYPFTPEFLDLLTKKVPELNGFQNTRGSLRFLSRVVRATVGRRPLLSSQDVPFTDDEVHNTLKVLDGSGGEVVRRALGDNYDAVPSDFKHRDALFAAILFYSITDQTQPGATEDEVLLATLDPGENANEIRDALARLRQLAFNLHRVGNRYLFRTQENPHARINAVASSPSVTREAWQAVILDTMLKRWGGKDRTVVYTGDADEVKPKLSQLTSRGPCVLLSVRCLDPKERLKLQNLAERRNLVLLVEPLAGTDLGRCEGRYDLRNDERLVRHARAIEACNLLLDGQPTTESAAVYREVRAARQKELAEAIAEKYGFYVSWNKAGAADAPVDDSWYELGRVEGFDAGAFLADVATQYAGYPAIKAKVATLAPEYIDLRLDARSLIDHFDKTPGEPVPTEPGMVARALRELAAEGAIALQDRTGRTACRTGLDLIAEPDLLSCVLVEPDAAPPREPEELAPLPVHPHVAAVYDPERNGVVLSWAYPAAKKADVAWQTLVQRYPSSRGWETGKVRKVDLDQTHETNRYIGDADHCVDRERLTAGARYHYYVFLVELPKGAPPRAILSQHCDVQVPEKPAPARPDLIDVPPQPQHHKLLAEVEKRVMSSKVMSADRRVRKVELRIKGLKDHPALAPMGGALAAAARGAAVETLADVTFVVRGELERQRVLDLVRALPKVDALYEARLYLELDTDEGEKGA